jgi:hypothetical protein
VNGLRLMRIKAAEALIAWSGANDGSERSPQDAPWGAVAVGPLLRDGDRDWTTLYECTGGASARSRIACRQLGFAGAPMLALGFARQIGWVGSSRGSRSQ